MSASSRARPVGDAALRPHLLDRIPSLPHQLRTPRFRRVVAALLVVCAALAAFRSDPDRGSADVVVAVRDLTPGDVVEAADLRVDRVDVDARPSGALTAVVDASGHTVASPVRQGETITDVRLLGPRLAAAAIGPDVDARIVPLRLADPELAELLRAGDAVDVVTVSGESSESSASAVGRILAADATVVLVSAPGTGAARREQLVLVALPADAATSVAAASLTEALTVTLR